MGLLDHVIVLFLIFEASPYCFSIVAEPIYIPTSTSIPKGSLSSTSSLILILSCLFSDKCSDMCEMASHCAFGLCFPDD